MEDTITEKPFVASCPFCGEHDLTEFVEVQGGYIALRCDMCGATGPISLHKTGAVRRWNNQVAVNKMEF